MSTLISSWPEYADATRGQADAALPGASAWVEANAGSGKTKVLIDRVARLLLQRVEPDSILLTGMVQILFHYGRKNRGSLLYLPPVRPGISLRRQFWPASLPPVAGDAFRRVVPARRH